MLLTKKIYCHWYCHWYWQDKHIGIAIAIDTDMEKTLPLLLPLILIWKKHCHCYWHWYCDMEKIAIDIAIDIVTGKILLLILSLVLLIPQPLLLLLPLEIWRPDNCYCYCSKNFAIAHVCYRHIKLGLISKLSMSLFSWHPPKSLRSFFHFDCLSRPVGCFPSFPLLSRGLLIAK